MVCELYYSRKLVQTSLFTRKCYIKVCLFTNIFLLPKRGRSLRFFLTPSCSNRLLASARALSVSSTPDMKPLSGRDKVGAVGKRENHRSIFALEDS